MKRILSLLLAAVLLVSAIPTAFAADTNDYSQGTQVVFTAANNESYTITVPASLNPGKSGAVTLEGYWPDSKTVTVTAEKTVRLTNSIKAADTKTLNVYFSGISEAGSNTSKQTFTETVSVEGISNALFGNWSGKFNYNVDTVEEEVTPSEDYIGTVSVDNTITLAGVETAGTYTLRYANADGALSNYADICSLEVTDPATAVSYDDLIAENCAPVEATTIAVYNAADEKVGNIALGNLATNLGTKSYSFGALADIHVQSTTSANITRINTALTYLSNNAGVKFTCIPGDLTSECDDGDLATLKSIIDSASTPVYVSTGNHDTSSYRESTVTEEMIREYTGHDWYYSFQQGNDTFIMFGLHREEYGNLFDTAALDWLYDTLEANRNNRCFLFLHVYPNNSSGDPYNAYGNDLIDQEEETFINELLSHYPNVTWFHGHSHFVFDTQAQNDLATIDTSGSFNSIHIPSLNQPRTLVANGDGTYTNKTTYNTGTAEGYVVDVYENGIVLNGMDFETGAHLPIGHYFINTTIESVEADTFQDSLVIANAEEIEEVWLYDTYSNRNNGTISAVGGDTNYSVTEPITILTNAKYRMFAGMSCYRNAYILYYGENDTFLGAELFSTDSSPRYGSLIFTIPDGATYFRVRTWTGGDNTMPSTYQIYQQLQ